MISLSSSFTLIVHLLQPLSSSAFEQSYLHQIPHQLYYPQNVHRGQKMKIKADDFFYLSASSNFDDFSLANRLCKSLYLLLIFLLFTNKKYSLFIFRPPFRFKILFENKKGGLRHDDTESSQMNKNSTTI